MKLVGGLFTVFSETNEPIFWKKGQTVKADISIHNRVSFQAEGEDKPFNEGKLPEHITTYDAFQKWSAHRVGTLKERHIRNLKRRIQRMEEGRQVLFQKRQQNYEDMLSGSLAPEIWVQRVESVNQMISDAEGVYEELTCEYLQFDPPGFFLIIVR